MRSRLRRDGSVVFSAAMKAGLAAGKPWRKASTKDLAKFVIEAFVGPETPSVCHYDALRAGCGSFVKGIRRSAKLPRMAFAKSRVEISRICILGAGDGVDVRAFSLHRSLCCRSGLAAG